MIVSVHDLKIEEILQLSLEGVHISACDVEYYSQWIVNNVLKFSKLMGVLLEGIENLPYLFFSEIEKMKLLREIGSVLNEKKKLSGGTYRELKRLETFINYDGRRK